MQSHLLHLNDVDSAPIEGPPLAWRRASQHPQWIGLSDDAELVGQLFCTPQTPAAWPRVPVGSPSSASLSSRTSGDSSGELEVIGGGFVFSLPHVQLLAHGQSPTAIGS
jgi:hypothetical protein